MANNALHLSEDKLNDLKEDTDYWTNKVRQDNNSINLNFCTFCHRHRTYAWT